MREKIIYCKDLVHIYRGKIEMVALNGISFQVEKNERVAIVGKSGSGKSTLLNILAGMLIPSAGEVRVANHNLRRLSLEDIIKYRRTKVGVVFQKDNLIDFLSVEENIMLPMKFNKMPKDRRKERVEMLANRLEIERYLYSKPEELSGGEEQRVAIAVALANNPPIILADEPTGSLDYNTAQLVYKLFNEIVDEFNHTLIIVSHDQNIENYVDRVVDLTEMKNMKKIE